MARLIASNKLPSADEEILAPTMQCIMSIINVWTLQGLTLSSDAVKSFFELNETFLDFRNLAAPV